MHLPEMIPVMVLPRCSLLPHGLLPLFIFEHRYRKMLSHALQNERFFCVGMHCGNEDDESDEAIHGHSTAALVRACVHHHDGTSHVILQGVQRIRFVGWPQRAPFRMAKIEKVETVVSDPEELPELRRIVLSQVCRMVSGRDAASLKEKMRGLTDTEIFADFVTANFVRDPHQCQRTLAMSDLNERLRYLSGLLTLA